MNDKSETQVIEINGVKLEVDMRYAKRIDILKVGSKVKILDKGQYGSGTIYPGVVVGFEPFESDPTIVVAYIEHGYNKAELKFASINKKGAEKWELVASVDDDLPIEKADVINSFNRERNKLERELEDLNMKEAYFMRHFNQYFEAPVEEEA